MEADKSYTLREVEEALLRAHIRIRELEGVLKEIAFSARTKTGMKQTAREALYGEKK